MPPTMPASPGTSIRTTIIDVERLFSSGAGIVSVPTGDVDVAYGTGSEAGRVVMASDC